MFQLIMQMINKFYAPDPSIYSCSFKCFVDHVIAKMVEFVKLTEARRNVFAVINTTVKIVKHVSHLCIAIEDIKLP